MFGSITGFEGSMFDEFRRLQDEMDELFSQWSWPAGIRSLPRGTFPAVNVGTTSDTVNVYVFAPGLDPKKKNRRIAPAEPADGPWRAQRPR